MAEKQKELSGSERAAIFLMSLSEKEAGEVMKHMPVGEVQRLGQAMASMRKVSRGQADSVLTQFASNVEGDATVGRSPAFLKRILTSPGRRRSQRPRLAAAHGSQGSHGNHPS
jgi:flagellar motor switch protein FliG